MKDEIEQAVNDINKQLKGFQSASVNYILDQLYVKRCNKVLIADEVGLGKTIIAKGVIAKATKLKKKKGESFHIVYICSNQVLAIQNVKKLNPFGISSQPLSRLIYLAFHRTVNSESPIQLSSLTPSTSFQLTKSVGKKTERAIIFKLLHKYADFRNCEASWRDLMQGNNQINKSNWNNLIDEYRDYGDDWLKPGLARKFKERLELIPFSKNACRATYQFLKKDTYLSFYHALTALLRKLEKEDVDALEFSYEIIKVLRKELTKECVNYLDADLFILDEFQRFKTLLDGDDETEATEIAKAVLHNDEAKVILLSATPFKPFTTQLDQLRGENHHQEFKKIVEYLGGSKGEMLWQEFKKDQEAFFEILRSPKYILKNTILGKQKKNQLESTFKKFLSRNERISVAKSYNDMTVNYELDKIDVASEDIKNFIAIDQLGIKLQAYKKGNRNNFGSLLEFSKSAPYPLSFLHGYQLKNYLEEYKNEPEIKECLKLHPEAWLDYEKIKNYKIVGFHKNEPNYPNGKFRVLANECFKNKGEFLLWVPPTKPRYSLFGKFKNAKDFSKILLFSGWTMAPRAIATLLSYEVERRTIGSEKLTTKKGGQNERNYFDHPRKPGRILVYSKSETNTGLSYKMWMFNLVYPSSTLYNINEIRNCKHTSISYLDRKREQARKIKLRFIELNIFQKFEDSNKPKDSDWYWISAPLLDVLSQKREDSIDNLREVFEPSKTGLDEHVNYLIEKLNALIFTNAKLGSVPTDLFETLAEITIASPANAALCSLSANFDNDNNQPFSLQKAAFQIADGFITLFNKPESISAVRLSVKKQKEYWKKVLRYCASGSIIDMVEEYIYLLKHCSGVGSLTELVHEMRSVLGVGTSSIEVDMRHSKEGYGTHNMRCHFAVNYGDQKMNTDSGENRMVNIRSVFNSPFRPFVLASTSVGQEGLDFHFYCRKIFHWNLPHNAIDLEQREGRINRYKGLVIRQKLTEILSDESIYQYNKDSVWDQIFALAEEKFANDKSGIKPFWYLDEGSSMIERFVPYHPLSKDHQKYQQLKSTLALYRITFGQPRQEELIQALEGLEVTDEELDDLRKTLLINLSPLKEYNSWNLK